MIYDSFWYMLDHPDRRYIGLCAEDIAYMTEDFQQDVYEASRGMRFSDREAAYRDWLEYGRGAGLEFAAGKNTFLKIILKVKDEPEMIRHWLDYHARIVGYHNLIVMDCGSTDRAFLDVLDTYRSKVLVIRYEQYYDRLHGVGRNLDFYKLLTKNCRYLTIIDADEYLFGCLNRTISPDHVLPLLRQTDLDVYAGTWFNNVLPPAQSGGAIDWSQPMRFDIDERAIMQGTRRGKSIVKASVCLQAKNIGHNLAVYDAVRLMQPDSFGKIGIFHLNNLGGELTRARVLKHLRAKRRLPDEMVDPDQIAAHLKPQLALADLNAIVRRYINRYLEETDTVVLPEKSFLTNLLGGTRIDACADFNRALTEFDFKTLWQVSLGELEKQAGLEAGKAKRAAPKRKDAQNDRRAPARRRTRQDKPADAPDARPKPGDKSPGKAEPVFGKGELSQFALAVLRDADRPLLMKDIVAGMLIKKGSGRISAQARQHIWHWLPRTLANLRDKGQVEKVDEGGRWKGAV